MDFKRKYFQFALLWMNISWLMAGAVLATVGTVGAIDASPAEFNRRATATAQILAGITPNPADPVLNRLLELDVWKEHQKWMTAQWAEVRGRIKTVEGWRDH